MEIKQREIIMCSLSFVMKKKKGNEIICQNLLQK